MIEALSHGRSVALGFIKSPGCERMDIKGIGVVHFIVSEGEELTERSEHQVYDPDIFFSGSAGPFFVDPPSTTPIHTPGRIFYSVKGVCELKDPTLPPEYLQVIDVGGNFLSNNRNAQFRLHHTALPPDALGFGFVLLNGVTSEDGLDPVGTYRIDRLVSFYSTGGGAHIEFCAGDANRYTIPNAGGIPRTAQYKSSGCDLSDLVPLNLPPTPMFSQRLNIQFVGFYPSADQSPPLVMDNRLPTRCVVV